MINSNLQICRCRPIFCRHHRVCPDQVKPRLPPRKPREKQEFPRDTKSSFCFAFFGEIGSNAWKVETNWKSFPQVSEFVSLCVFLFYCQSKCLLQGVSCNSVTHQNIQLNRQKEVSTKVWYSIVGNLATHWLSPFSGVVRPCTHTCIIFIAASKRDALS